MQVATHASCWFQGLALLDYSMTSIRSEHHLAFLHVENTEQPPSFSRSVRTFWENKQLNDVCGCQPGILCQMRGKRQLCPVPKVLHVWAVGRLPVNKTSASETGGEERATGKLPKSTCQTVPIYTVLFCSPPLFCNWVFYLEPVSSFLEPRKAKLYMIKFVSCKSPSWILSTGISNAVFCFFFPSCLTWI